MSIDAATDSDGLTSTLSADGRFLAVLHQTRRLVPGTTRQVQKGGAYGIPVITLTVGEETVTNGVELIDLQAGRTLGYRELDTAADNRAGGSLVFAPDGQRLYAFTSDQRGTVSATTVGIAGGRLEVEQRATNGQNGHVLPAAALAAPHIARVRDGGATLVRFDLPDRVRFFDLAALTLVADLELGRDRSAKVAFPVGLYTPDGSMLYVANADAGTVRAVDLTHRAHTGTVTVPAGTRLPDARPRRGAGPGTAALAPDGTRVYLVDGQAGSGLAVVELPGLQPSGRWLPERTVHAVWPTPDGQTIFTLGPDGVVSLIHSDGSVVGTLPLDAGLFEFVPSA